MRTPLRVFLLMLLSLSPWPAAPAAAEEVVVSQRDKAFAPGELKLKAGDTIVFRNDDPITHNIFSRSENAQFNLKMQAPGQDLRQRFDKPGTAVVRCAIHPKMKLVVQVEE